jgi:hypothetical protein
MGGLLLYCVWTASVSSAVSATLATVWAKRRSYSYFLASMIAVWVLASFLPLTAGPWDETRFPPDLKHFVATAVWVAPIFIGAGLALVVPVATGCSRKLILFASLAAAIIAAPIGPIIRNGKK